MQKLNKANSDRIGRVEKKGIGKTSKQRRRRKDAMMRLERMQPRPHREDEREVER